MDNEAVGDFIARGRADRIWDASWPFMAAFGASWCVLVLEIAAARLLAPYIGVSILTWTSVIGVILAGISVGNMAGGALADRGATRFDLGAALALGGALSLLALPMASAANGALSGLPFLARVALLAAALFFAPSVALGCVTPIVAKLALRDLNMAGRTIGGLYAISTAGGIAGVYCAGFWLLQWFGVRGVIVGVAIALFVMAIAFGGIGKSRRNAAVIAGAFAICLVAAGVTGAARSDCDRETRYFCLNIETSERSGREIKALRLDSLIHSFVDIEDAENLIYAYERALAELAAYAETRARGDFRTLIIGGGGYTLPRYLDAVYDDVIIDVIELDPEITRAAIEELGLREDSRIYTYNGDARLVASRLRLGEYDFVSGDAYNDVSVPYHLTTIEFMRDIKRLMSRDGVYAANILDTFESGEFLRATVKTMGEAFKHVYVIRSDRLNYDGQRDTFIVAASDSAIDRNEAAAAARRMGLDGEGVFMREDDLADYMARGRAVALTDDYAPVDSLLMPVLLDRQ